MRNIKKDRSAGKRFRLGVCAVLFLPGLLLCGAFPVSATILQTCSNMGWSSAASVLIADLRTTANQYQGNGSFEMLRSGQNKIAATVYPTEKTPDNTVFAVNLRGVHIGTLSKITFQGPERWTWSTTASNPSQVARVGDELTITRNGQPFVSGTFLRPPYNWAYVLGSYFHDDAPQGFPPLCSGINGYIYLPGSQYPRRLAVVPRVWSNSPVTRISVNGPSATPGQIGPEIANVPLQPPGPTIPPPPGWMATYAQNDNIQLTEQQFDQLTGGQLSTNVFTQNDPEGFVQMQMVVYYINGAGGDFEGDGQADFAVFRPADRAWYVLYSSNNVFQAVPFGTSNDTVVIGDYDHDGKTDITAFQADDPDSPGLGVWKIRKSSEGAVTTIQWGLGDDIPLSMDLDGNNTSDLAVFRPSNGTWYIRKMGDIIKPRGALPEDSSMIRMIFWGMKGDKPLAGDFNADGRDEIVVFRPSEGNWYIYDDVNKTFEGIHWGMAGDIPMARDFDGDARADLAVFRPSNGTWYIRSSMFNTMIIRAFGLAGDIPVPGDFDKDGVSDIAVFRPSDGMWYVTRSSDNTFFATHFGLNGDVPAMAYQ